MDQSENSVSLVAIYYTGILLFTRVEVCVIICDSGSSQLEISNEKFPICHLER